MVLITHKACVLFQMFMAFITESNAFMIYDAINASCLYVYIFYLDLHHWVIESISLPVIIFIYRTLFCGLQIAFIMLHIIVFK